MIANEPLRDVVKKEVEWIWKPFIPLSKLTLIQGATSVGKTNILIHIMALLSNGIYPPTMHKGYLEPMQHGEPVKIYYVTRENGIEDTYTPFFDDFKGNRDWVEYQKESRGHFVLTGDEIRDCVRITGAKLIVVDPWQGFLYGFISSNNKRVREMIDDVQSAADETGAY